VLEHVGEAGVSDDTTVRPLASVYFSNGMRIDGAGDAGGVCCDGSGIGATSNATVSKP
jgi:hypothetical protein